MEATKTFNPVLLRERIRQVANEREKAITELTDLRPSVIENLKKSNRNREWELIQEVQKFEELLSRQGLLDEQVANQTT